MTLITIPKELTKRGDLVLIPREEYDALLRGRKKVKTFTPTAAQKRVLRSAERRLARGEYVTLEALKNELARHRR